MLFDQIARNKRRTWLLLFVFFLLTALMGGVFGHILSRNASVGVLIAFVISGIYLGIISMYSIEIVMSMNGGVEIEEKDFPIYYHIVQDMALVAQVPMPKVYVVKDPSPNAFAVGFSPNEAAVAATTGLFKLLNREEIESVMGHEIGHIRNYDTRLSTICVSLTSAINLLSDISLRSLSHTDRHTSSSDDSEDEEGSNVFFLVFALFVIILVPISATLIQLAISRQREFLADASSVEFTRNPRGMISALRKLEQGPRTKRTIHKASRALYINAPVKAEEFESLFRTHPPIPDRIARLEEMMEDHYPH